MERQEYTRRGAEACFVSAVQQPAPLATVERCYREIEQHGFTNVERRVMMTIILARYLFKMGYEEDARRALQELDQILIEDPDEETKQYRLDCRTEIGALLDEWEAGTDSS